mgnify:CR=1 FL=1
MEILAHRGDTTQAHENTLAAFQAAYDSGADGFEFDIRLSRDGVPVVYHNLMIGDVFIADLTYAEIQKIQLSPDNPDYDVPTLEAVLDHFAGKTYLEIHVQSDTRATVDAVCKILNNYPALNDMYELTSFEPAIINTIHDHNPAHPCDLLFRIASWMTDEMAIRLLIDKAGLANVRGVHLFPEQINSEVLSRFDDLNLLVHCGVTNDIELFKRVEACSVSQILTDNIHLYL